MVIDPGQERFGVRPACRPTPQHVLQRGPAAEQPLERLEIAQRNCLILLGKGRHGPRRFPGVCRQLSRTIELPQGAHMLVARWHPGHDVAVVDEAMKSIRVRVGEKGDQSPVAGGRLAEGEDARRGDGPRRPFRGGDCRNGPSQAVPGHEQPRVRERVEPPAKFVSHILKLSVKPAMDRSVRAVNIQDLEVRQPVRQVCGAAKRDQHGVAGPGDETLRRPPAEKLAPLETPSRQRGAQGGLPLAGSQGGLPVGDPAGKGE